MLYDISPTLDVELVVWPGDTPLSREVQSEVSRGDLVTLSAFRTTAHLGAHADAPSHVADGVTTIDEVPIEIFLGPCQVVRVNAPPGSLVLPEHLPDKLEANRVLIATGSNPNPRKFNENFVALSHDAVHHLADRGVQLIGVDTPSVDPYPGDNLPSHQACLTRGVIILEGLVLADVPQGVYELIALPLKLRGFDASPIRAILRTV